MYIATYPFYLKFLQKFVQGCQLKSFKKAFNDFIKKIIQNTSGNVAVNYTSFPDFFSVITLGNMLGEKKWVTNDELIVQNLIDSRTKSTVSKL